MLDPTVPIGTLKVKGQDIHRLVRLCLEDVNRQRWVRSETYPGPYKKPARGFEDWWVEYQAVLEIILGQDRDQADAT